MADLHVFDGFAGTWTRLNPADTREMAMRFVPQVGGVATSLRWRRPDTSAAGHPTRLHLWDSVTQTVIATADPAPDNGAVGWQEAVLATPPILIAGREYRVAGVCPSGSIYPEDGTVGGFTPPSGLAFGGTVRAFTSAGTTGYPSNTDSSQYEGFDIGFNPTSTPSGSGATPADVNAELASWLISTGDNTHQIDGLPWLTKTVVDAIKTIADNVPQDGGTSWTDALKLWKIAGALTDAEIAAWNLFARRAPAQLTGGSGGGGSAFFTSDGRLTSDLVAQVYASTQPSRSLPPGTGWTLVDETDWTDTLSWPVAAHCYLATVTAWPSSQPATSSPAGTWLYRLGWWTILNGSLSSGREWFEFAEQFLYAGGLKMPGVALFTKGGSAGHIQAWSIT